VKNFVGKRWIIEEHRDAVGRRLDVRDNPSTALGLQQSLQNRKKTRFVNTASAEESRVISLTVYPWEGHKQSGGVFDLDHPRNLPKKKRHTRQEGKANVQRNGDLRANRM